MSSLKKLLATKEKVTKTGQSVSKNTDGSYTVKVGSSTRKLKSTSTASIPSGTEVTLVSTSSGTKIVAIDFLKDQEMKTIRISG